MTTVREHFAASEAEAEAIRAIQEDGFDSLTVVDLAVSGSITSGGFEGVTGEFEGTFKKVKIKNGIITEFELE